MNLGNGRIEIDNNRVENAIRPTAEATGGCIVTLRNVISNSITCTPLAYETETDQRLPRHYAGPCSLGASTHEADVVELPGR